MALPKARKKKTVRAAPRLKRGSKLVEPSWEGWEKLSGQEFHRKRQAAHAWYYENYAGSDLVPAVFKWMETADYSKEDIKKAKAAPVNEISTTAGICAKLLLAGMPDYYPAEAEYWASLPGTSGELKPVTDFIKKRVTLALEKGTAATEEKKAKEEEAKKKEKYVPSIQERIREASYKMSEFIEEAHDEFLRGKRTEFKSVQPASMLRQLQCKQPHARNIKAFYDGVIAEYAELLTPQDTKKMTEHEKDMYDQLKEGYSYLKKSDIKKLYEFYVTVQGACDAIIAESKASRKPRKVSKKSPEKIVEKLKYKISDDKYAISSIQAHKLVGANCLVVFNAKTRKLGIYYTSVEDPLGSGRDGSGLDCKGTTLQRFDEDKSVACTLRKPMEQLQEVKQLNTRKKFENWFAKLTTTPVKMNGRINPETVLLAAY